MRWLHFANIWWLLVIVAIVVFVLVVQANAHDPARPDLDKWFGNLTSGRGLCCTNNDGIFEPEWESKDGHYRVKLKGEWVDVPDDAVIKGPNLDGRTVVWPMQVPFSAYQYSKGKPAIRCFMPGTMT